MAFLSQGADNQRGVPYDPKTPPTQPTCDICGGPSCVSCQNWWETEWRRLAGVTVDLADQLNSLDKRMSRKLDKLDTARAERDEMAKRAREMEADIKRLKKKLRKAMSLERCDCSECSTD
jgi:hypothetical protein